jgi:hypothetical protein
MPNINLNISSLSILFIAGSIALYIWFPDRLFTPDFARALFWWFLALGVVRWIERGIIYFLPTDQDGEPERNWFWYTVSVIAFLFFVGFLIVGIRFFASALTQLQ